jgi:hypothetical protein
MATVAKGADTDEDKVCSATVTRLFVGAVVVPMRRIVTLGAALLCARANHGRLMRARLPV